MCKNFDIHLAKHKNQSIHEWELRLDWLYGVYVGWDCYKCVKLWFMNFKRSDNR